MTTAPYWQDANSAIYLGDARDVLATMAAGSADCIVTSPPYWAKRDYGVRGQYGHEPDPAGYIETMRVVFREARRVLADDGTCWLNLGDSYSVGGAAASGMHAYIGHGLAGRHAPGMGAKNLLGLPWRVALALQDDGWTVRNAIVWHKPNAMPESVRDRLNCRYELVFLLVKSRHYWFDLDPIRVPHLTVPPQRHSGLPVTGRHPGDGTRGGTRPSRGHPGGTRPGVGRPSGSRPPKYGPHAQEVIGARRYSTSRHSRGHPNGRNPGDVWSIRTRPYRGPHFAAFPIELPIQCIKAGCKPGGIVLDPFCGTGTTGLAALALGRRFTGIELSSAFAALAADGCGMPPRGNRTAARGSGNDRHAASRRTRHAARTANRQPRHWRGKKASYPQATTALLAPSQTTAGGIPSQARCRAGPRTTADAPSR